MTAYRRVVISRYGGPEVLHVVAEEALPEPRSGEVRIKVLAAGVAWGDVLKRGGFGMGKRPPFTPGYDVVGTVDDVGGDVSHVAMGEMVAALPLDGGYAEYLCVKADELVRVPAGLDAAEAVCLVTNYVTAHQMLHRCGRVRAGERVLVHSAAGGVGTAVLQLGRLAGLELHGTASRGKHDLVRRLGGIPIDHRADDYDRRLATLGEKGLDVVFDPFGGSHVRRSYRLLRPGGRVVVYGAHTILSEGKLRAVAGMVLGGVLHLLPDGRRVHVYGITRPKYSKLAWRREDLSRLLDMLAAREIEPIIGARLPLGEAARAHALLENGDVTGKIVLLSGSAASEAA